MRIIDYLFVKCLLGTMVLAVLDYSAVAQTPVELNLKTPYYIEINSANPSNPYEIYDGLLHLQYQDKIGEAKEIQLTVSNWKLERVGRFVLEKSFGLNNYTIDLNDKMKNMDKEASYYCSVLDESGTKYEWSFKQGTPLKSDLEVDIIVSPERVSCKDPLGNFVEFAGKIQKGKAPYSIRWYVINDRRTDFLYQPKEFQLDDLSSLPVIQVDKAPAYYVMLDVTDACGANVKRMVLLECGDKAKRINTLFVAPLDYINDEPGLKKQ